MWIFDLVVNPCCYLRSGARQCSRSCNTLRGDYDPTPPSQPSHPPRRSDFIQRLSLWQSFSTRQEDLTAEKLRLEGDLIEEYITNSTWRGEVCPKVQVCKAELKCWLTHNKCTAFLSLKSKPQNKGIGRAYNIFISSWRFLLSLNFWIITLKFIFHIEIFRHTGLFKNWYNINKTIDYIN